MKKTISSILLYFICVLPAAAKTDCHMTWHLPEGDGSKDISFTGKGEAKLFEHLRIKIEADGQKSSFLVYPTFSEKWAKNAAYSMSCTQHYACTGYHAQPQGDGSTEKVKKFFFDPKHPGVARIRERPILRFRPGPSNFRYDFYRNDDDSKSYFWHLDVVCHW